MYRSVLCRLQGEPLLALILLAKFAITVLENRPCRSSDRQTDIVSTEVTGDMVLLRQLINSSEQIYTTTTVNILWIFDRFYRSSWHF